MCNAIPAQGTTDNDYLALTVIICINPAPLIKLEKLSKKTGPANFEEQKNVSFPLNTKMSKNLIELSSTVSGRCISILFINVH